AAAESTLKWIPMVRLAQAVARRLPASQANSTAVPTDQYQLITSDAHLSLQEKDAIVEYVVAHYVSNMRIVRAVCHEFTVRCLFVWAPSPAYKYDKKLHKTFPFEGEIPAHHKWVYAYLEKLRSPDFLFLGDLTENATQKVYVDDVHYNEITNEHIANKISKAIRVD